MEQATDIEGNEGCNRPDWAPEHSDALREYLARGMSYSEIAERSMRNSGPPIPATPRSAAPGGWDLLAPPRREEQAQTAAEGRRLPPLRKARGRRSPEFMRPMPVFERVENVDASLCRNRAAPSRPDGSGARRLPLSLWRRRGGRSDHLLRPSAAQGFELLHAAFSSYARPGHRIGTGRRHRLAAACCRRHGHISQPQNVRRRTDGTIAVSKFARE